MNKVKDCILSAKLRILLEIWSEDYIELEKELKAASQNGVKICLVVYGRISCDFADIYYHDMNVEITDEFGGRWLVLSKDDSEVIAGVVSLASNSRAAWTMHQGLVMPITEVIIHDLYINEIMSKHRDILEKIFGKDLIDLRHKYVMHPDMKKHYIE